MPNSPTQSSSASAKFSILRLMEVVKPAVREKLEFENRDVFFQYFLDFSDHQNVKMFCNIQAIRIPMQRTKQTIL